MKQAHFQKGFYVVIPLSKNSVAQQHMSLVEKSQKCPEDLSYKTQWDNFWTKKSAKIYKIFFILSYMTTFGNKKVHYALCAETFCNIFPYIFYFDQPALISWEKIFFFTYLQNIFFIQRREVKRISLQKNEDYGVKIRSFLTNE